MSVSSPSDPTQSSHAVFNSHPTGTASNTKPTVRPTLHSFSGTPSDPLHPSNRPAVRKVSFSDVVITSCRVEKPAKPSDGSPTRFAEDLQIVEKPIEDETGPKIHVELIQSPDDELIRDTPLAKSERQTFEVRLGMLKQATIYRVQFTLPDALPAGEIELIRYSDEDINQTNVPFNIGAKCRLLSSEPVKSGAERNLVLELCTTRQSRINEFFTLRLVRNPVEAVHLILQGLALGRGQGTPFLRLGIHRVSENPDFDDSDEFTEWPGFVNNIDEEDEPLGEEAEAAVEDAGDEQQQPAGSLSEPDRTE